MLSQLLAELTTNDKLIKVIYRPFYLNSYHLYLSDDVFGCVGSWEGALDWDILYTDIKIQDKVLDKVQVTICITNIIPELTFN